MIRRMIRRCFDFSFFLPLAALFAVLAVISRMFRKPVDVGIGPEPINNNIFLKKALEKFGYTAETFVSHLYFITSEFDVYIPWRYGLSSLYLAFMALFRYRALYIYFNGGPLAGTPIRSMEPWIYRLAGMKTLVMPYGSDIQELEHCPNLCFKHALNMDYPLNSRHTKKIAGQIAKWSRHATHIVSGCDWVDYTPRWDTLCLAHFCIDAGALTPPDPEFVSKPKDSPVTILHAPNHKEIKGSRFFIKAVEELRTEGYNVELKIVQRMPNVELRKLIREADIIADQLLIGWYAMFALEGMSAGKPVLCYIRDDLKRLYEFAGLIEPGELPLVACGYETVKETIRGLLDDPALISSVGRSSREYAVKHHSLETIGHLFDMINRDIGLKPSGRKTLV